MLIFMTNQYLFYFGYLTFIVILFLVFLKINVTQFLNFQMSYFST